jgi:hypothetical protein
MGSTVLPKGDFSNISTDRIALLIEPPLFSAASIISSGDYPLPTPAKAVGKRLDESRRTPFPRKRCAWRRMDRMSGRPFWWLRPRFALDARTFGRTVYC